MSLYEEKTYNSIQRLKILKTRARKCVCKYCGSKLKLNRILYGEIEEGRIELFCTKCGRIEFGIEPEIYAMAKYFVDEFEFNMYPANDFSERTRQLNIAKVGEIIEWGMKNIGILSEKGFSIDFNLSNGILEQDTIFRDDDLTEETINTLNVEESQWRI